MDKSRARSICSKSKKNSCVSFARIRERISGWLEVEKLIGSLLQPELVDGIILSCRTSIIGRRYPALTRGTSSKPTCARSGRNPTRQKFSFALRGIALVSCPYRFDTRHGLCATRVVKVTRQRALGLWLRNTTLPSAGPWIGGSRPGVFTLKSRFSQDERIYRVLGGRYCQNFRLGAPVDLRPDHPR